MSQNEAGEEVETEVTTEVEDDQVEETTEQITVDQALAWKKSLEKANKKIAILEKGKKSDKAENVATNQEDPKKMLSELLDERDFFKGNPDAELYRDKIDAIRKEYKGISLDDALYLASKNDKAIEANREVYGQGAVGGEGNAETGVNAVSVDTFDNWTPQQQDKYMKDMTAKHGKVKFK